MIIDEAHHMLLVNSLQRLECQFECLKSLTIQTGINEPRYATLRAIKQANAKEIEVVSDPSDGPRAYTVRKMFVPEKGEGAELLGSDAPAVAARIAEIVKARLS